MVFSHRRQAEHEMCQRDAAEEQPRFEKVRRREGPLNRESNDKLTKGGTDSSAYKTTGTRLFLFPVGAVVGLRKGRKDQLKSEN
jgi:hypothetical protein